MNTSLTQQYLAKCLAIANRVQDQEPLIQQAANLFATTISKGRCVHLFGSGHSRIMVEEMWPRYGSFPGFNPIVELSLTNHHAVVGANGQRQAMFLENVSGLADRILRNFGLNEDDSALIISSSGCNIVPIEMAEIFQQKNIKVVAIISTDHSVKSTSKRTDGKKLSDFADIVLDTGAPIGDAMLYLEKMEMPIAPGSTVGGVMLINCLKAETAKLLCDMGQPPSALVAGAIVGNERAAQIFESAYDNHAHRMAKLYENAGK